MSTLKVAALQGVSASSDAITLANDGTCTANITNNLSNRNLIINGDMRIAQRGTSSTSTGYQTIDRFFTFHSGTDEAPTYSQADVSSGTTPYTLGFRKSFKITNGNQTGGAGTADQLTLHYTIEAQDIANSGWNYTSSSSYITLSFWIKSSVAQDFKGFIKTEDGTEKSYPFATGSLSADTWTKVTKSISGDSGLTFDNNANKGFEITWSAYQGTDVTGSVTENAWMTWSGSTRTADQTSTWYTTNDATLEITGVQLEVDHTGSGVATDFEHRSFGQELALCQRYTYMIKGDSDDYTGFSAYSTSTTAANIPVFFSVAMRAAPSFTFSGTARFQGASNDSANFTSGLAIINPNTNGTGAVIQLTGTSGLGAADRPGNLQFRANGSSLTFSAEL